MKQYLIILEGKMKEQHMNNAFYYYLLATIFLFCENGHSTEAVKDKILGNKANTHLSEIKNDKTSNGCFHSLPPLAELGGENAVKTLIKEADLRLGQDSQSAFSIAKHYVYEGSTEAFQCYMLYHTLKGLELFTKENLRLIEEFALKGSERARGYFVEAYGLGGNGRIEIDEREQQRTQKVIEKFAAEGFKGAIENLQYLKLYQMLESSTKVQ